MISSRSALIWTFAGGCLSGATLIGLWPEGARTVPEDARSARAVEQYREPTVTEPVAGDTQAAVALNEEHAANVHDVAPAKAPETDSGAQAEPGSSVSDILLGLEAAYRQGLADARTQAAAPAPAHAPARELPAHEAAAISPPAPAAPVHAAAPAAPTPRASEMEPRALVASREEAPPRQINIAGDLRQNTNVGTVNEGPVVMVQEVVQYVPYYPYLPPNTVAPPAYGPRPITPRSPVPSVHFRTPPTSLDGPFKYPVDLVH